MVSAKQKYFSTTIAQNDFNLYALAKIFTESQNLYKHEMKLLLEENLIYALDKEKSEEHDGWKVSIFDFEKLSRRAEKLVLRDSKMSLKKARAGSTRRLLNIACDETVQKRDRIMAEQAFINITGLDAKYTGGLDDDISDELGEALAAIAHDEEHGGLNSDIPDGST